MKETKKMNTKIHKKQTVFYSKQPFWTLIPLFFIITILPLIVRLHTYQNDMAQFDWYPPNPSAADLFLYYKQQTLILTGVILLGILIRQSIKNPVKPVIPKLFYPLFAYALLALLSSIFSTYRSFAFKGSYEQFENIFCILSYVLIAYYCFLFLQEDSYLTLIGRILSLGAILIGTYGTLQFFRYNLFEFPFYQKLVLPSDCSIEDLSFNFEEGRVYATLFNPNYVGVYTTMLIPVFITLLLFSKKIWERLIYCIAILLLLICMVGSESKAGILSLSITLVILIPMLIRPLLKRWYRVIPFAALIAAAFFYSNKYTDNVFIDSLLASLQVTKSAEPSLESIVTDKDRVRIVYKGNPLNVYITAEGNLGITDEENTLLDVDVRDVTDSSYTLAIKDERFPNISVTLLLADNVDFGVSIDNVMWYFKYDADLENYLYLNPYNRLSIINDVQTPVLKGYEKIASNRGYLWSRTIPLLKDYPVLGSGQDTFTMAFPQTDYVGRYNNGYADRLITKPHCLYLQIGVQTGVVSLIAFLIFYLMYFGQSVYLYFGRKFTTISSQVGVAAFLGSISYMICSLTNDSSITVAPVFWVLIGTGIAANQLERRNRKQALKEAAALK